MVLQEKFLDQLEGEDYDTFIEYLQPEMAKARKTVAGKQIVAVCPSIPKILLTTKCVTSVERRCIRTLGSTLPTCRIPLCQMQS